MRVINNKLHDDVILPNAAQCPHCGGKMNVATSASLQHLEDGDIGICAGCGEFLISCIDKSGYHLRKLTSSEAIALTYAPVYPTMLEYQKLIRSGKSGLKVSKDE